MNSFVYKLMVGACVCSFITSVEAVTEPAFDGVETGDATSPLRPHPAYAAPVGHAATPTPSQEEYSEFDENNDYGENDYEDESWEGTTNGGPEPF
ncbi:hypothetical protein FACS1894126_4910 [Alphaproteobacteria bacterium]|nr:hypothetical protein FACS1894126_4910 [Alphaproteobacteria bacterium]